MTETKAEENGHVANAEESPTLEQYQRAVEELEAEKRALLALDSYRQSHIAQLQAQLAEISKARAKGESEV